MILSDIPSLLRYLVLDVCICVRLHIYLWLPVKYLSKLTFFSRIFWIYVFSVQTNSAKLFSHIDNTNKYKRHIALWGRFPWVMIAKATPSLDPSYRHMSITPAARFHTWRTRYWYFHPIQNSEMIRKRCKSILICFILVTSFFLTKKKTVSQSK